MTEHENYEFTSLDTGIINNNMSLASNDIIIRHYDIIKH